MVVRCGKVHRYSLSAEWYHITPNLSAELEGFNLLDTKASAIDYYYQSRLPGEPAGGVNDIHFHPIESRSIRATVTASF